LPIIAGSSLVDKGFLAEVVEAVVFFWFLSACVVVVGAGVLAVCVWAGVGLLSTGTGGGSAGLDDGVCPTAAKELASSDTIRTKALVARENLFISENLQRIDTT